MGNNDILKNFQNEINRNKESGSYLFYGDERINILDYALIFSKMLITKNILDNDLKEKICNQIDNFQYTDVEVINREKENIKIDEVRKIIYSSVESSYSNNGKVFILCGIEQLRKEAANGLLKIIEEPPKNVYFILLSRTLNILSTIKSRVVKFHLKCRNYEELDVSKDVYNFFDGNENYINMWKKEKINLEDEKYTINSLEEAIKCIEDEKNFLEKTEINKIMRYNKSIEFICREIRGFSRIEYFNLINFIDEEYRQDREGLIVLLNKIILKSKNILNSESLSKLINIKNSIRNNVNIRSILFNFFEYLY